MLCLNARCATKGVRAAAASGPHRAVPPATAKVQGAVPSGAGPQCGLSPLCSSLSSKEGSGLPSAAISSPFGLDHAPES